MSQNFTLFRLNHNNKGEDMEFIDQFEKHYDYDCNYMRKLASAAPDAFETFINFLPMGRVGNSIPADILWVVKISAMLTEDCGACVQLNIKMAIEAGVDTSLLKDVITRPEHLKQDYKLAFDFAHAIARNTEDQEELINKMNVTYTKQQIAELSLAIASTKIYPTIKRALGEFKSCSLYQFEF